MRILSGRGVGRSAPACAGRRGPGRSTRAHSRRGIRQSAIAATNRARARRRRIPDPRSTSERSSRAPARRRQERLGKRGRGQIAAEIHDQEAVVGVVVGEEPQRERLRRQHAPSTPPGRCARNAASSRRSFSRSWCSAYASACVCRSVEVEHAALEGSRIAGIVQRRLLRRSRRGWETASGIPRVLREPRRRAPVVVGKVQEGRRRREFLALKQHRRARHQEQQRRHRPPSPRAGQLMPAQSARGVGDLIVVLQEVDELAGRRPQHGVPRGCRCQW